jgi:hypothetical protein
MGSIPLLALDVRQPEQPPNLISQYGQLMAIKGQQAQQAQQQAMAPLQQQQAQQQVQSGAMELQQRQQDLKDQQGISNWFMHIDPKDPDAFNPTTVGKTLASQGVSGKGIMAAQGQLLQHQQTAATLTKDQLANQQQMNDSLYSGINGIIGVTDPQQRAQAITALLPQAVQSKALQPQQAQQLAQNPAAVTDDQLKALQHGLGISSAFLGSVARMQTAQTGAQTAAIKAPGEQAASDSLVLRNAAQQLAASPDQATYQAALGELPMKIAKNFPAQFDKNAVLQAGMPPDEQMKYDPATQANLAAVKAGAEAKARQPFEMALARQRQALSQGDPNAAAQLLLDGDATLSELKARGSTPQFIAQTLQAAHQMSGGKYNAQSAESQFSVAKSPQQVQFFGSAKSLTDPGGTLDQLAESAKKIPQNQIPKFNSIEDWAREAAGSGPLAEYASRVLGVADDYSKVMGGGVGSDQSRLQAANLVSAKLSKEGREGALNGIRGSVNSQIKSRIGNNAILQRMYGDAGSGSPTSGNDPFAQFGGKAH